MLPLHQSLFCLFFLAQRYLLFFSNWNWCCRNDLSSTFCPPGVHEASLLLCFLHFTTWSHVMGRSFWGWLKLFFLSLKKVHVYIYVNLFFFYCLLLLRHMLIRDRTVVLVSFGMIKILFSFSFLLFRPRKNDILQCVDFFQFPDLFFVLFCFIVVFCPRKENIL